MMERLLLPTGSTCLRSPLAGPHRRRSVGGKLTAADVCRLLTRGRTASSRLQSAFVKAPAAVSGMALHCAAAPQTTEAWRSDFEESLDQLQQGRSWGRSQDAFSSMSAAHPGDLVSAAWRAAAAHNAGCAALRLGQLEEAAESFARALNLSSGETSDAFAAVAAVSNLGVGVCLLTQRALASEATPAVDNAAKDHLIAAHKAASRSAAGGTPSSAEVHRGLAAVQTTTSYYAALSLLCALSPNSDGRVGARAAHACIERVRLLLGSSARSSMGGERAHQLMEDIDSAYRPITGDAGAEALSAGDDRPLVPWPPLKLTCAHLGGVVPPIALHADGTPIVKTVGVRANGPRPADRPTERPSVSVAPQLAATPSDLARMLRECCVDRGKPLLAVTGSGLSRACGLPTRQELWSSDAFERDLDVTAWGKSVDPDRLWRLVHYFYQQVDFAPLPTRGHAALDQMVDRVPGGAVVTQNVDGLHRADAVHEVHGSLLRFRCDYCGSVHPTITVEETREGATTSGGRVDGLLPIEFYKTYVPKLLDRSRAARYGTVCHVCHTKGHIRPDVVLFGEDVRLPASAMASEAFGAVVVVGTAGDVYPSSVIAQYVAQRCSCPVAVVDPAMTRLMAGSRCDMAVRGNAEQVLVDVAAEYLRCVA